MVLSRQTISKSDHDAKVKELMDQIEALGRKASKDQMERKALEDQMEALKMKFIKFRRSIFIEQIVNLLLKNRESNIVLMIVQAARHGNPILPKKKFLQRYERLSEEEFNSSIAKINLDCSAISTNQSHSIISKKEGYYVSPLHVKTYRAVYKKMQTIDAANSLLNLHATKN